MMFVLPFFILFVSSFAFGGRLGPAPFDPEYENKMYSIYSRYHAQSLSPEQWQSLISNRDVNTYSIQKGDNLWDISRVLFGDSNYWPKLWSVNADLSNPHRVDINHTIQIVMGNEESAPRAVITNNEVSFSAPSAGSFEQSSSAGVQAGKITSSSVSLNGNCSQDYFEVAALKGFTRVYDRKIKCRSQKNKITARRGVDFKIISQFLRSEEADIDIPPPIRRVSGKPIPPSLPPIKLLKDSTQKKFDLAELSRERPARKNILSYYLVEKGDVQIVGEVEDITDQLSVVTSEIIVELEVPAERGSSFSLIRPLKKISSGNINIRGPFGYEVELQAVIEVKEPVPGRQGFYFSKVKTMYNPITIDAQVIEQAPMSFSFDSGGRPGEAKGVQIVGVPYDQSSDTLMIHSFIYLNKGSEDEVRPGDVLMIQANPRFHTKPSNRHLGEIVVVHASRSFSTGFVKNLNSLAYLGDFASGAVHANYFEPDDSNDIYTEQEEDSAEDMESEDEEEELSGEKDGEEEDESGGLDEDNFEETGGGEGFFEGDEEDLEEEPEEEAPPQEENLEEDEDDDFEDEEEEFFEE